ncbi:hypothetical protein NBO_64g0051 [Nosema bombycis CQ1]|uniref:Uncharacterized protein n=1 Tax=Nosema bombycis (strain CQ1 / CVCC 102059) TaxID=578461 RepID=R0MHP6_NOSB1|nr:hypothetical protein NBO_64g0051 [Nosema bombycis CQ1]|eukprot:EOB13670.1 hypothetical protein NBO_64g0051 [Nosema bombycis CQ1]
MISFKDKIQILRTLKTDDLDLTEVTKYLDLLKYKSLAGVVLDKHLDALTDIDTQMTAVYLSISDEEWIDLISDYDTPIEKPIQKPSYSFVRNNLKIFINAYKALDQVIPDLDLNILFNSLSKVLYCRTTSLQFLFFSVAKHKPNAVLHFLLDGVTSNPSVYIPYFVSFVSRFKFDCSKFIEKYCKWIRNLYKKSNFKTKSLLHIQATQGLIYICCFRREFIEKVKDLLDFIFSENICSFMNSNVVEVFCSLSGYKCNNFKSLDNHVLDLFPFDKSILQPIHELYEDYYVEFEQ